MRNTKVWQCLLGNGFSLYIHQQEVTFRAPKQVLQTGCPQHLTSASWVVQLPVCPIPRPQSWKDDNRDDNKVGKFYLWVKIHADRASDRTCWPSTRENRARDNMRLFMSPHIQGHWHIQWHIISSCTPAARTHFIWRTLHILHSLSLL